MHQLAFVATASYQLTSAGPAAQQWEAAVARPGAGGGRKEQRARPASRGGSSRRRRAEPAPAPALPEPVARADEPRVTKHHVVNALSTALSAKVYGAHHLRQQAAIADRRADALQAANANAAQLIDQQRQLVRRSVELRQEVLALAGTAGAEAARLGGETARLSVSLAHAQAMEAGLEHCLTEQSDGLAQRAATLAATTEARPQTLPARALLTLEEADLACDDGAQPPVERVSPGSAEDWSVTLTVQGLVDAVAAAEEEAGHAAALARRQAWLSAGAAQLAQLRERLRETRAKRHPKPLLAEDYQLCAQIRREMSALRAALAAEREDIKRAAAAAAKLQALKEELEATEEEEERARLRIEIRSLRHTHLAADAGLEEGGWSRPRRRLMALLNGTFGLPVTDPDKAKALKPFGQVQEVSTPFSGDKTVSVRSGASAQHLLFGEKYSARWDLIKGMVYGLVEEAVETAPVHRPPPVLEAAVWEWRDVSGRRAWHAFDRQLGDELEARRGALLKQAERLRREREGLEPEEEEGQEGEEETEPPSPMVRWSEEAGGLAEFVVDLERMLHYSAREAEPLGSDSGSSSGSDGSGDSSTSDDGEDQSVVWESPTPVTELVAKLVPLEPLGSAGDSREHELSPLVRELVREVRRRDPSALSGRRAVPSPAVSPTQEPPREAGVKAASGESSGRERQRTVRRSSEAIVDDAVRCGAHVLVSWLSLLFLTLDRNRALMEEATRLGRRDRAMPIGTRIWVQDLGEGWYEGFARNPKFAPNYAPVARRGPSAHRIRFEPPGGSGKTMAGRARKVVLVGPEAPKWEVLPPMDGSVRPRWENRRSAMGVPYTRWEFRRHETRQEQVGGRELVRESRFWMDATANNLVVGCEPPVEDLQPDEEEEEEGGGEGEGDGAE